MDWMLMLALLISPWRGQEVEEVTQAGLFGSRGLVVCEVELGLKLMLLGTLYVHTVVKKSGK
jgi:hypothetical protein